MRLIDADAVMEILTTAIRNMEGIAKFLGAEDDPEIQMEIKAYTDIANGINDMPTIETERNKGKWTLLPDGNALCSERGYMQVHAWDLEGWDNYCHHCGADIRCRYEEGGNE